MRTYPVYKGLQKPLVYKGFKGKFIYWGLGILLTALVCGALLMAIINMYFGAVVMVLSIIIGFAALASRQKKGLHSKNRMTGIFIHSPNSHLNYVKKTRI